MCVDGEGWRLDPAENPIAQVVAMPDADGSPETLAGLAEGTPSEAQLARRARPTVVTLGHRNIFRRRLL